MQIILVNRFTFLCSLTILSFLFTGCSKDEGDPLTGLESDLIGLWTLSENYTEIKLYVGEQTYVEYLMDAQGLTQEEAQLDNEEYLEALHYTLEIGGTIEFKSNHMYVSRYPGEVPEEGTWKLNPDGKTIILDEGVPGYESTFVILSFSGNAMTATISENMEDVGFVIRMEVTVELTR